MNYGNIKECDIADGPGVRVTLFVSISLARRVARISLRR